MEIEPIRKGTPKPCPVCGSEELIWDTDHFECGFCTFGKEAEYKLWSYDRWNRFCRDTAKAKPKKASLTPKQSKKPYVEEPMLYI